MAQIWSVFTLRALYLLRQQWGRQTWTTEGRNLDTVPVWNHMKCLPESDRTEHTDGGWNDIIWSVSPFSYLTAIWLLIKPFTGRDDLKWSISISRWFTKNRGFVCSVLVTNVNVKSLHKHIKFLSHPSCWYTGMFQFILTLECGVTCPPEYCVLQPSVCWFPASFYLRVLSLPWQHDCLLSALVLL